MTEKKSKEFAIDGDEWKRQAAKFITQAYGPDVGEYSSHYDNMGF